VRDLAYTLYENTVQNPPNSLRFFDAVFLAHRGRRARTLREDFCGTFQVAAAWVASRPDRAALALDHDLEPLAWGRRRHRDRLPPDARRRLSVLRRNVVGVTRPAVEIQAAENYSYFALHDRALLLRYLRAARASLTADGMLLLDTGGGPGFVETRSDRRRFAMPAGVKPRGRYSYIWDQRAFDPVTRRGDYRIHFRLPGGRLLRNAFCYDWRLWTIPEMRDALLEAGFRDTAVWWEQADVDGDGNGTYAPAERADNDWSWNAYVCGLR